MSLNGHAARISGLALCYPGGEEPVLASVSWDETVRVWPVGAVYAVQRGQLKRKDAEADIQRRCSINKGHKNRISDVDSIDFAALLEGTELISPDESLLVSGSLDNTFRVYSVALANDDVRVEFMFKIFDTVTTWWLSLKLFISPKYGPLIISGGKDHSLRIWKLAKPLDVAGMTGTAPSTPLRVITGHTSRVINVGSYVDGDQSIIVTTCKDFVIRFWDLETGGKIYFSQSSF